MAGDSELDRPATRAGFARRTGISVRRVGDLLTRGTLKPGGTLGEWMLDYCAALRTEAATRATANASTADARARLATAKAELAEIQTAELRGDLVTVQGVIEYWGQALHGWRAK